MHQFIMGGGVGAGLGRVGQLNLCVETIHYFEGINVTFLEIIHQFIVYILGQVVQSVSKERVECSRGWGWDGLGGEG